ncbi:MAG: hypothetical protein IAG10_17565 [Planctomycetaceae bacterium]|nr:hypothetical protein [Planctomycetaceae bacterium]
MMSRAGRHHLVRWGSALVLLAGILFGIERYVAEHQRAADDKTAATRVSLLANATADGVPFAMEPLEAVRDLAIPKLRTLMKDSQRSLRDRSHAAYALAKFGDTSSTDAIINTILDFVPRADGGEANNIVVALRHLADGGSRGESS